MLEDRIKVAGGIRPTDIYREVEPVAPYPRINPQQQRREGYTRSGTERQPEKNYRARRRFTAMRDLIDELKEKVQIVRTDFNTANQELTDRGLAILEDELIAQLLQLKIPLDSIDALIHLLKQLRLTPNLVAGRILTATSPLFPFSAEGLSEYLMRFDDLQVHSGVQSHPLCEEINHHGRFETEQKGLRLTFRGISSLPPTAGDPLRLTVSVPVGAIEVDDSGRRAILYQRPDQVYVLYSDKSISLSI